MTETARKWRWRRLPNGEGQYLVGTEYSVRWSQAQDADGELVLYAKEWAICLRDANLDWRDTMKEAKRDAERRAASDDRLPRW